MSAADLLPPPADSTLLSVGARIPCTKAEGPGRRYALWVRGCPLRCPGCCNPHLLEFRPSEDLMPVAALAAEIAAAQEEHALEGVTFIGGEPFAHAAPLAELARRARALELGVMVFSGFTLSALRGMGRADVAALLAETDLLVDGPYIERLHVTDRRWIGSSNQRIHFLSERYRHLDEARGGWDRGRNSIELRLTANGEVLINGFPHCDVTALLSQVRRRR